MVDTARRVSRTPTRSTTWTRWNVVVLLGVLALLAVAGWQRRWVSDDGLIVTRTVRQLLAGNGPVFNVGERAEANTSTLWTYLLALVGLVVDVDLVRLSVVLGLVLFLGGVALALDAARRLHRDVRGAGRLVPLGALVLLGVPPFWDFATSGLETGLVLAWLGGAYRGIVVCSASTSRVAVLATAVGLGLGPLVRPEMAVASAVFLVVLWWRVGAGWRRAGLLAVVALAVPVAYQVFRMGYYGMLVPQTAVAKSAGAALWGRGARYLLDLTSSYALVVPLLLVAVALVLLGALRWSGRDLEGLVLVLAPLVVAGILTLYVLRVGGDFMHARMLLPPLFLTVLPVLVVPAARGTVGLVALTAGWALVSAVALRPDYLALEPPLDPRTGIADERAFWVDQVAEEHPLSPAPFVTSLEPIGSQLQDARPSGLVWRGRTPYVPIREDLPWDVGVVMSIGGTGGNIARLDEVVLDPLGLTYPLAAHVELGDLGRPGHEKVLPDTFIAADVVQPGADLFPGAPPDAAVAAAREALTCGDLAEMQAAVRAPLTPDRFAANLLGAVGRTSLTVPRDPAEAVATFCR